MSDVSKSRKIAELKDFRSIFRTGGALALATGIGLGAIDVKELLSSALRKSVSLGISNIYQNLFVDGLLISAGLVFLGAAKRYSKQLAKLDSEG